MQAITIHSINADRQERYDIVRPEMVAKTIKILQRIGQLQIKVISMKKQQKQVPQLDKIFTQTKVVEGKALGDIKINQAVVEVAPGIFQSVEDYEANHRFDEARDNKLQDNL